MDGPAELVFWSRVDQSGGIDACWPWMRGVDGSGYGFFRRERVHRLAYEFAKGPIPAGLTIDHLCRNRRCANPAHLEAVTRGENVRRGGPYRMQTHCKRGHLLAETRGPSGRCRLCHNAETNARYHRTKVLKGTPPRPPVKGTCPSGHDLTDPANVVMRRSKGYEYRRCLICERAWAREAARVKRAHRASVTAR